MKISKTNLRVQLLVFRGNEAMGEYPLKIKQVATDDAIREVLSKLKPDLSAVILGPNGVYAQSANLPKDNPWYRELVAHL